LGFYKFISLSYTCKNYYTYIFSSMLLLTVMGIEQKILNKVQFLKDTMIPNSLTKKLNRNFKEF